MTSQEEAIARAILGASGGSGGGNDERAETTTTMTTPPLPPRRRPRAPPRTTEESEAAVAAAILRSDAAPPSPPDGDGPVTTHPTDAAGGQAPATLRPNAPPWLATTGGGGYRPPSFRSQCGARGRLACDASDSTAASTTDTAGAGGVSAWGAAAAARAGRAAVAAATAHADAADHGDGVATAAAGRPRHTASASDAVLAGCAGASAAADGTAATVAQRAASASDAAAAGSGSAASAATDDAVDAATTRRTASASDAAATGGGDASAAAGATAAAAARHTASTSDAATASSTSESSDDDDSDDSDDDRFSTECTNCNIHISRSDRGMSCDVFGCRATQCNQCLPEPTTYLCRQHGDVLGAHRDREAGAAETAGAARVSVASAGAPAQLVQPRPPHTSPAALIRALPEVLRAAAKTGVDTALRAVEGWSRDHDMCELVEDLVETLEFNPSTRAKGSSAVTRLEEYLAVAPSPLRQALASASTIDILLSSFVTCRLRAGTRRAHAVPDQWKGRPIPDPVSVRGEVAATVGLLRLAALLPADPRGTLPITRRAMKKCGCLVRKEASPRGYTFLWEWIAAWEHGIVPRDNPQAIAVAALGVTAIHFLLRPIYVRSLAPREITPDGAGWLLRWAHGDKTRRRRAGGGAAAAATAAGAGSGGASAAAACGGSSEGAGSSTPAMRGLPPSHPRLSAAEGSLLSTLLTAWRRMRGPDATGRLFCRTERARQTSKVPKGARLVQWQLEEEEPVPTFIWPDSRMSERMIKTWMVRFLTPLIGKRRALRRVISGFRGGGEMEFVELGAPLNVRATVGWWVSRRISAEGALVTYEGSSVESMRTWSARLGSLPIIVLAPGVYRYVLLTARSTRLRAARRARIRAAKATPP